ncbi:unnamed protein product [Vicia faba]|uniref:Uncharacterized protein n=1 Tax=Vicia faba TaxID=3906 RepID=A0AAV1BBW5_VICFA|nr:unnamed protein product [Vicia faba]
MVGVVIGAFVIYCLIPKDGGKILPTSSDTTLAELFKQHPPLSVEIHMPPSPLQLTSPNDSVEESLQHPSPDNDSVEELSPVISTHAANTIHAGYMEPTSCWWAISSCWLISVLCSEFQLC